MDDYSMWLVEYGTCTKQPVSSLVYGRHNSGIRSIPFTFLVVKGKGHLIAVDTGYYDEGYAHELTVKFGVDRMKSVDLALSELGFRGADFDTVILTHAHYDHIGGIKAFPNAHFIMQEHELLEWMKVLALPKEYDFLSAAINPGDIANLVALMEKKSLTLVDGPVEDILPDISLHPVFDSHTYGLQLVRIRNHDAEGSYDDWIFTSDACYSFDNLSKDGRFGTYFPVGFGVGSITGMVRALETIRVLSHDRLDRLIIPHEAEMWRRFPVKKTSNGMYIAEICLAAGEASRIT